MEDDLKVRKVTQDVLLFVWFEYKLITKKPAPELCAIPDIPVNLIKNLSGTVCMNSENFGAEWKYFLSNHFERMTSSNELFANYVAYALYVLTKIPYAYDCFFDSLTLVTYIGLYCWRKGSKKFINACAELFCSFFEKNIRTRFEERGGLKNFNEYIERDKAFNAYISLEKNGISLSEHLNNVRDYLEKMEKKNSSINGVIIGDISQSDVETDKTAVTFAKSIADKINLLCEKEFNELLKDFAAIDSQVKTLYSPRTEETSNGMARKMEKFSSQKYQKEASQIIPSKSKAKRNHRQRVKPSGTLKVTHSTNTDSKDVGASDKALIYNPMSRISERVKNLLSDISTDIGKLSDMKKSLCQEHGVRALE